MPSKGENAGRAFPTNLLGGYRWPGRKGIDAELTRTIVQIEIFAPLTGEPPPEDSA
jgi:hypothetical protein